MGFLKKILSVFKCSSNCSINDKEIDIDNIMSTSMNDYKLKFKDINKIVKILNKRDTITKFPKTTISSISL